MQLLWGPYNKIYNPEHMSTDLATSNQLLNTTSIAKQKYSSSDSEDHEVYSTGIGPIHKNCEETER